VKQNESVQLSMKENEELESILQDQKKHEQTELESEVP
jgi:hypothetical protein